MQRTSLAAVSQDSSVRVTISPDYSFRNLGIWVHLGSHASAAEGKNKVSPEFFVSSRSRVSQISSSPFLLSGHLLLAALPGLFLLWRAAKRCSGNSKSKGLCVSWLLSRGLWALVLKSFVLSRSWMVSL